MSYAYRLCVCATVVCLLVGCVSQKTREYAGVVQALSEQLFLPGKCHELNFVGYEVPSENGDWPPAGFYVSIDSETHLMKMNGEGKDGFVVTRFIPYLVEVEDELHDGMPRTVDISILTLRHEGQEIPLGTGQTVYYWVAPGDSLILVSRVVRYGTDVTYDEKHAGFWRSDVNDQRGSGARSRSGVIQKAPIKTGKE